MNFPEIHSATGMMELILKERLFAMQDKQYAAFQAKLTPGGGCVKTTHPLFLQTKPRLSHARALSCPKDFVPLDIENLIIWQRYIIVLTIPTESSFFHKE